MDESHARDPKAYHWTVCGRALSDDVRAASIPDGVTCDACRLALALAKPAHATRSS
jgi:hypothetical protein